MQYHSRRPMENHSGVDRRLVENSHQASSMQVAHHAPRHESAIGSAPRRREPSVREGLTRIIVDRSGSWRAAWSGNRPVGASRQRSPWAAERSGGP